MSTAQISTLLGFLAGASLAGLAVWFITWRRRPIDGPGEAAETPSTQHTAPAPIAPPAPTSPASEAAAKPAAVEHVRITPGSVTLTINGTTIPADALGAAEIKQALATRQAMQQRLQAQPMLSGADVTWQQIANDAGSAIGNLRTAADRYIQELKRQNLQRETDLAYAEREAADLHRQLERANQRADTLQAQYIACTQQALAAGMKIVIDYGPHTKGTKPR